MKVESKAYRKDGTEVVGSVMCPLDIQIEIMIALYGDRNYSLKENDDEVRRI